MFQNPRHHFGSTRQQLLLVFVIAAYVIALAVVLSLFAVPTGYGAGPIPAPLPGLP
jgi:hypothetical protein